MSTPHVAGLAALLLSQHPSLKSDELRQIVRASSDDIHFPGFDAMSGSGRINAARAIQTSSTIQVAITSPKHISVVNSKSIEIRGTALGQNFKQMQLFYSLGNQNEWNEITVPRNRPAQNEALGRWELSSLPLGWKLLRLEALDRNGLKFEDVINVGTQIKTRSFKKATNGTSFFPRISGNLTVWVEGNFQIGFYLYLYDKKTNKKIRIGDKRYTNPDICISGNFIAWNDYILDQRNIHICVYDAKTATCPVQRLTTGILTAMSGNRLVYDLPGSIVTYDISQKSYKTIGSGTRPDIDGDHVIWQKHIINTDHNDIALYDLRTNTERMLTNTTEDESYAKISGKWVVFRRRYGNGDYYNFVSYNLETGKETVIEDIPLFDFSLSDKYLIWASYSGPIVLYNLETNKSEEIVIYPQALRKVPFVSGSRIIWTEITDYQNGMGGIHTAVLPRRFQ